jgi:GT2 family glycosyltransferase
VAAALNTGIKSMAGDYFSWLSHDDLYYPQKIETQLAFLERASNRPAMLYSDFDIIDADSTCTGIFRIPASVGSNPLLSILATLVHGCSTLVSKEIFNSVGLFDERLRTIQDNDMWMRILRKGFPLFHVPEILIRSRRHERQGQHKLADVNRREARAFFKQAAKEFGDSPEQSKAILDGAIRSGVVLPLFFLWAMWVNNPTVPPSGWTHYLCRRILNSLRWRIQRSSAG